MLEHLSDDDLAYIAESNNYNSGRDDDYFPSQLNQVNVYRDDLHCAWYYSFV